MKFIRFFIVLFLILTLSFAPIKQAKATGIPTVDLLGRVQEYFTDGPPGPYTLAAPQSKAIEGVMGLVSNSGSLLGLSPMAMAPVKFEGDKKDSKMLLIACDSSDLLTEGQAEGFYNSLEFMVFKTAGIPVAQGMTKMETMQKAGAIAPVSDTLVDPRTRYTALSDGKMSASQMEDELYKIMIRLRYSLNAKAKASNLIAEKCYEAEQKSMPINWIKLDAKEPILQTASLLDNPKKLYTAQIVINDHQFADNNEPDTTVYKFSKIEDEKITPATVTQSAPEKVVDASETSSSSLQLASTDNESFIDAASSLLKPASLKDLTDKNESSVKKSPKGIQVAQGSGSVNLNLDPMQCLPNIGTDLGGLNFNQDISLGCLGSVGLNANLALPSQYTNLTDYLRMCGPSTGFSCSGNAGLQLPKCPINLKQLDPMGALFNQAANLLPAADSKATEDVVKKQIGRYYIGVQVAANACEKGVKFCAEAGDQPSFDYRANCTGGENSLGIQGGGPIGGNCDGTKGTGYELIKEIKQCAPKTGGTTLLDEQPQPLSSTPKASDTLSENQSVKSVDVASTDLDFPNQLLAELQSKYNFLVTQAENGEPENPNSGNTGSKPPEQAGGGTQKPTNKPSGTNPNLCGCPTAPGEPLSDNEMTPTDRAILSKARNDAYRSLYYEYLQKVLTLLNTTPDLVNAATSQSKARDFSSMDQRAEIKNVNASLDAIKEILRVVALLQGYDTAINLVEKFATDPIFVKPGPVEPGWDGKVDVNDKGGKSNKALLGPEPTTASMTPLQ